MFDPITAALLRSAPAVPGLNADDLPRILTGHYAGLVAARLRGEADSDDGSVWPLERIANTYEIITSLGPEPAVRRAAAFVAATAHQIIARRDSVIDQPSQNITRDSLGSAVASALLFLAAEQYADAQEAATRISLSREDVEASIYEAQILSEHIVDLASGTLGRILERAERWRTSGRRLLDSTEDVALRALLETLTTGIELLAARTLGQKTPTLLERRFDSPRDAFSAVLDLCVSQRHFADFPDMTLLTSYSGPRHLASLLLSVEDGTKDAALCRVPPPTGANDGYWEKWLAFRAEKFPFVWENHRQALAKNFHQTGKSAVLVLPTGAGKTTVSSLKIAGALARGKKVIFLAPTHALVEQLTNDLQKMFPKNLFGASVSNDFDLLLLAITQFKEIEVMTPEGCLAMLSYAPEAFAEVGLLVFDECHLLSPESGKIRRSLDSMLCILAFNKLVPTSDFLFLSAMLKNGEEFAGWIAELTERDCISVDLLWKPSRQARGVVIYEDADLEAGKSAALKVQQELDTKAKKVSGTLRSAARKYLVATPHAIWGLQHNWLTSANKVICKFTLLANEPVSLAPGYKNGRLWATPNANHVAAVLAAKAANSDLKTIVFVNTKDSAVSVASSITARLGLSIKPSPKEAEYWSALDKELGGLVHSALTPGAGAVPHNSRMLRLERELAEAMFSRQDGAKVIVATPTLAQGLNLPAQFAILAGDKRADAAGSGREELEAHEILNAAARAGRAGHLANGVVLLIPEPIISRTKGKPLDRGVVKKLRAVLPENDRCVTITDALGVILDRVMMGSDQDRDVQYTASRMATLTSTEGAESVETLFRLDKSLAAYVARKKALSKEFNMKLEGLRKLVEEALPDGTLQSTISLASRSGLSVQVVEALRHRVLEDVQSLPATVAGWIVWLFKWLSEDQPAFDELFYDAVSPLAAASGRKKPEALKPQTLAAILPGLEAWVNGATFRAIEKVLGGDPDGSTATEKMCPRARALALSLVPRGLSYLASLLSSVVKEVSISENLPEILTDEVNALSAAIRLGFSSYDQMNFAKNNPKILSRVEAHEAWKKAKVGGT